MNKIFKTISNFKNGMRVVAVASELARGQSSGSATGTVTTWARRLQADLPLQPLALMAALASAGLSAWALPQGGQVVHGQATIATQGNAMTIQQAAGNATLNWSHFNVGTGESVRFNLANPGNITLNRVGGDSVVHGSVTSNGNLWFATGGNLFTVGSNGAISAMKEVFVTTQDMAVGQYVKPTGAATAGAVNVLPAGKLAARLIHIDAGSVNMSRAQLVAESLDDVHGITVIGQKIAVTDSTLTAGKGDIVIGREGYGTGALAHTTDVSGSTFTAQRVETSAEVLTTSGAVVKASTWLLDPTNVTISAAASSGGTMASAQGQSGTSNFSTTDIQNAINAGTSVNVMASGTITQTSPLSFNVTSSGATPTLSLYNGFGAKKAITLAAITDNSTAAGSGVSVKANSAGGAITVGGAISIKGDLILDNSFAVGGGISGFIQYSNAAANALGPIAVNAAISAGSVSLTGVGYNNNGVTVSAAITSRAGSIDILGVSNATNGANGVAVNAQLRSTGTTGDVNVTGVSSTANGVLINAANVISDNGSISLSGSSLSTGAGTTSTHGLYVFNTSQFVSAKSNLVLAGYASTSSNQYGVYSGGALLAGGNLSIGGYGTAGGAWLGSPGVYFAGGNLNITGARLSGEQATIDSNARATATGSNAHGVALTSSTTATSIATGPNTGSFTGLRIAGTATVSGANTGAGGFGVWIGQGGGDFRAGSWSISASNAGTTTSHAFLANTGSLTSTSGAIAVNASTTSTGAMSGVVNIGMPVIAAGGFNVSATGTSQPTVVLISGALTNAAGNISITGNNAAAGSNNGISMGGAITQNANGGNVSFVSNNAISQTGAITLAANTSGTASAVLYDTTSGDKTSTITAGALTLTGGMAGSTTGIDYTMKSSGSALSVGAVTVPGAITLDNTWGAATGARASGYITSANLSASLATNRQLAVNSSLTAGTGIVINYAGFGSNVATGLLNLNSAITSTSGDITIQSVLNMNGTLSNAVNGSAGMALLAKTGKVDVTGTILGGSSNWAIDLSGGTVTANQVTLTAINANGGTNSAGINAPAITIQAGASFSASNPYAVRMKADNMAAATVYRGVEVGRPMVINSSGGSVLVTTNRSISQSGAITVAANTSGLASSIVLDTTSGNSASTISATGAVTAAAGSTIGISYAEKTAGAAITAGAISLPGAILLDNTYGGTAGAGGTPSSGFITAANAATLTTASTGITLGGALVAGNLAGSTGVTLKGVSTTGIAVKQQGHAITSNAGGITLVGAGTTATTVISGSGSFTSASGDITVSSSNTAAGGNWAINLSGAINQNASGGSIRFSSNQGIYQSGTVTVAANTSGTASGVTYTTTAGNKLSQVQTGSLTLTGGMAASSTDIDYSILTSGAPITVGAIAVPGSISLNNSYLNGVAGGITLANANTYATSTSSGLTAAALTAGRDVNLYGVTSVNNTGLYAVTNNGNVLSSQRVSGGVLNITAIASSTTGAGLQGSAANVVFQSGTSAMAGGDITLLGSNNNINATGYWLISGGNHITAYGANVNWGTAASPVVSGWPNRMSGNIRATAVGGVGGNINIYGSTLSAGSYPAISSSGSLTADGSITIVGTKTIAYNSPVVDISGAITLTGVIPQSNLLVRATQPSGGGNAAIAMTGTITQSSNGGNISFVANGPISQTGAISVIANTSGADSRVLYDTTLGNRLSTINAGAITVSGNSSSPIHYSQLSNGAQLLVNRAINVPGAITLDNTYLNGSQGGITSANAWSLATQASGGGIPITASLTAGAGIYVRGVVGAASSTAAQVTDAVSIISGSTLNLTTGGTFTPGEDAIRIVGITPQFVAAAASATGANKGNAIQITGAGAINLVNNSVGGNTTLTALTGRYNDVVSITNASTAGAIYLNAMGASADILTVAGTTFTQNSNSGIYIASSNGGNVSPPRIVNNGTGPVVIAAGAYLPVGTGTGGQIVGVSGNTISSPNGNVYLYGGQPGASFTDVTKLAYLDSMLGSLSFNNTVFSQAYADTNIAATSLPSTAINITNLPSANTKTGSSAGPAIQFRVQPSYQMVLGGNLTKVYGAADPSIALNSVATPGTLQYALAQNFTTPATNPTRLRNNAGVTEIILSVNGTNFYIPLTNFLNSITGTRAGYGVLAGEQVYTMPTSGAYNANYSYSFTSSMGILVSSGVLVSGVAGANPVGLSITPRPLTITSHGTNFTYDGVTKFAGLYAVNGLVSVVNGVATGDSVTSLTNTFRSGSVLGSGTPITNPATTVVNAGTYNGSPSAAVGTGLSNYSISYVGAAFTVAPAPLSVTGSNTSRVYSGSAQSNGAATITGLKGTEGITVTGYATGTTVTGGPYTDNLSVTWGTALASNYTLTTTNGTLTITPAPLSISALPVSTTYGTAQTLSASSSVVANGLLGSDTVTGVSFTYNGGSTVPGTLGAGTYANALVSANATGTGLGNYTIGYGTADLVVNKANLTISQPAQTVTYNGTWQGGTASSSLGTVSGNTLSTGINGDTFTITGTASGTHAGSYNSSLLASGGSSGNYNISYTNGTLTIQPATLTISAASATKVYDGTTASSGAPTVSGLFGLDTVTGLGQAYASKNVLGAGASTLRVNSGYAVIDGNGGANYTVTLNPAAGTITPKPLTVTGITAANKVYDGTHAAGVTASGAQVSGMISGDAVTASVGAVTGTFADVNVGAAKGINLSGISLSGGDAGNYTLAGAAGVTADITPRPVLITGATTSNTYTASTQTNAYTVEASTTGRGVVAGESIAATGSGAGLNVGTYTDNLVAVAGAGTALSNYSISLVQGRLTITPVTLGAVASASSKVYDAGTATTGSIALTGLLGADAGTVSATGTFAFGQSDAGSQLPVTVTGARLTGAASGNYVLPTLGNPTASITPAPLTVRVNNDGKLYSLTDAAGYNGYSLSGFVAGQNASVLPAGTLSSISVTRDTTLQIGGSSENSGTYAGALKALVSGSAPAGAMVAGNYALSFVPGDFTIASQGAALIKTSNTVGYGAAPVSTDLRPVVSYVSGGNAVDLTFVSATASGSSVNYVYKDGANNNFSFTLTSPSATSGAAQVPVGSYDASSLVSNVSTAVGAITSGVATAGSLTVTPAAATITANAASTVYNGQTQNQTATTSGILANDKVAYTGLASGKNVAQYRSSLSVTANTDPSSADSGNYTFTLVNSDLTITPYQLSLGAASSGSPGITATANHRVYNGTTGATGTLTPLLFAGDTLTASAGTSTFDNPHVGTGKTVTFGDITLNGTAQTLANYSLPNAGTLTALANITPAPLTLTGLGVNSKRYDGTTTAVLNASGATLSGVMAGDSISINAAGATGTFASKNVGSGIAVTVSNAANALTANGATQLTDYVLNAVTDLSANIAPAPLTITGLVAASKVYDGNTAAALTAPSGATLSGVVPGDLITLNASGASGVFADKNVGNNIAVSATLAGGLVSTGTGSSNIPTLLSNYTLGSASVSPANITPAPLTVTGVTAANKVYDGSTSAVLNTGAAALLGVVAGETLTLDASGMSGVFDSRNAGNAVPVTVSGATVTASGGASLSNYTLTQVSGVSANITPAPLVLTGLQANHKVYDATTQATLNTSGASVTGVVPGDVVTVSLSGATGIFADMNVGNGIAVTVSGVANALTAGAGTSLSNYSLVPVGSLSANITPAPLTITGMTAASKVYDGSVLATLAGGTLSGVKGSDSITLNTSGAVGTFASKDAGNAIAVSVTGNTVSAAAGTLLSNYTFADPADIVANITPRPLTVSGITAANKVYDGSTAAVVNALQANLSGMVSGEFLTLDSSAATGQFSSKNASGSAQPVTVQGLALVQGSNALLSNYSLGSVSAGNALITPAPLSVTGLVALDKVYDRNTSAQIDARLAQLAGVVAGDSVSFANGVATGTFADRNAANGIAVSVSNAASALVAGAGTTLGNYSLSDITGLSANITPRPITTTGVTVANKVYDGTAVATVLQGTGALVGVLAGDSIALDTSSASGTFASPNAGNGVAVSVTGAALMASPGSSAGNYALAQPTGLSANITPAALVVAGVDTSQVYNGTPQTNAAASISGLVAGESLVVTGYGTGRNVGTYTDALVVAAGPNTRLSNYDLTLTHGSLTVTPYALNFGSGVTGPQITASVASKVYDATTGAAGSLAVTGLFAGDTLTASAETAQFDNAHAGTGKTVTLAGITLGGAAQTLANYTLNGLPTVTALADIARAPLKVHVQNDAKFVTQTDATGASGASVGYNGYQMSGFVGTESASVLGNPVITVSRHGIPNPAAIVPGASNEQTGVYPGALTAAGPATIGNYALSYVPGDFTIVPAGQLLVRTAGASGVYAGTPVVPAITSVSYMDPGSGNAISTLTLDPAASGNGSYTYRDNASGSVTFSLVPTGVSQSTSGHARVGSYALAVTDLSRSGTNLSSPDAVITGNVQITPKAASLTATAVSSVYNGALQTQTFDTTGLVSGDVVLPTGLASGTQVGSYASALGVSGADASNYNFTLTNAALGITPAPLTVRGLHRSTVYSASAQSNAAAEISGLAPGETLTITGYGTGTNAGTYADALVVSAGANTRLDNYTLTTTGGTLTITPYQLALGASASGPRLVASVNGKAYDGTASATGSLSVLGLLGNDVLTATASTAAFDSPAAGVGKTASFGGITLAGDALTLGNYSLAANSTVSGQGDVTPALATVTAIAATQVYTGQTQNQSATATGYLDAGDPLQGLGISGLVSERRPGSYRSRLVASNGNYSVTVIDAPFVILPDTPSRPAAAPDVLVPASPIPFGGPVKPLDLATGMPSAPLVQLAGGGSVASPVASAGKASAFAGDVGVPGAQDNRNVRNYDLVGFASGSDALSAEFKDLMGGLSERKVVITGYADLQEADPMGLSLRRAQLARDYLVGKGWKADNITLKAAGATDQFDKQALAPNRRVYIHGDWPLE